MEEKAKEEIRTKIEEKLAERNAITKGKARITSEEERRYNNLGKVILELRRKIY